MLKQSLICSIITAIAVAICWQPGEQSSVLRGHSHEVFALAFSPDGKTLASGSGDFHFNSKTEELSEYGELKFWDLAAGKQRISIDSDARFWTVAFSPDGKLAVTGSGVHGMRAGLIQVWDWQAKQQIAAVTQEWLVQSLAISRDGQRLATVCYGSPPQLWQLPDLKNPISLTGHNDEVKSVAFSPDGRTLATGSWDKTVKIWDVESARCVRTLRLSGEGGFVSTVAFSPDGSILAVGSGTVELSPQDSFGTVTLWDTHSGNKLQTLPHAGYVTALAFSPDGTILASGSRDKSVVLWNPRDGSRLKEIIHSGPLEAIAFSPHGQTLATAGRERECAIRLWDMRRLVEKPISEQITTRRLAGKR